MYGKFPASQLVSPINSLHSAKNSQATDLSDIGLCSLNILEHSYNILLAALLQADWQLALAKSAEILSNG